MYFQTRILFVSFLATVILSIFIIPMLRKLKIGQVERDDGPKSHFKKEGTPTMGGIIIALGIVVRKHWWSDLLLSKRAGSWKRNYSASFSYDRFWNYSDL